MSNIKNTLGERMKRYEAVSKSYLTRRVPVIIRIDGKAFHTFTKGMCKPFDRILMITMQETMKYLCENIQGCVFGYTQSDEITLVLTDYEKLTTDAWFGYNLQKMTSISASMATLAFNKIFRETVESAIQYYDMEFTDIENSLAFSVNLLPNYLKKYDKAMFDARAFSVPKDEVCNCLIWRQQDATRNSIESVGQAFFSQKQLMNKSCKEIQEMLWQQKDINWNDFPTDCKRGSCCYKVKTEDIMTNLKTKKEVRVVRNNWVIDTDIPIFTQDRSFIERWL